MKSLIIDAGSDVWGAGVSQQWSRNFFFDDPSSEGFIPAWWKLWVSHLMDHLQSQLFNTRGQKSSVTSAETVKNHTQSEQACSGKNYEFPSTSSSVYININVCAEWLKRFMHFLNLPVSLYCTFIVLRSTWNAHLYYLGFFFLSFSFFKISHCLHWFIICSLSSLREPCSWWYWWLWPGCHTALWIVLFYLCEVKSTDSPLLSTITAPCLETLVQHHNRIDSLICFNKVWVISAARCLSRSVPYIACCENTLQYNYGFVSRIHGTSLLCGKEHVEKWTCTWRGLGDADMPAVCSVFSLITIEVKMR